MSKKNKHPDLTADIDGRMVDVLGEATRAYALDELEHGTLLSLLRSAYARGYTDHAEDGGVLFTAHKLTVPKRKGAAA